MARDIFRKAQETEGKERLDYVRRLKRFGSAVGPEKYAEMLGNLMTNEATINELEKKGREEAFRKNRTARTAFVLELEL